MDEERIDFSALDPARSARQWEARVQATLAASQGSLWLTLSQMRVGVFAMAAVAVLSWVPALFTQATNTTKDPALALLQYTHAGDVLALIEATDGL